MADGRAQTPRQAMRPRTGGGSAECTDEWNIRAASVSTVPPTQEELDATQAQWIDLAMPGETTEQLNTRMHETAMNAVQWLRKQRLHAIAARQRHKELEARQVGQQCEGNPLEALATVERQPFQGVATNYSDYMQETPEYVTNPQSEAQGVLARVYNMLDSNMYNMTRNTR